MKCWSTGLILFALLLGGCAQYEPVTLFNTQSGQTTQQVEPLRLNQTISAGLNHSMVVKEDHTLWVFGNNRSNQLGNDDDVEQATPIKLNLMNGGNQVKVIQVAGGDNHSIVLSSDGEVYTFGENRFGELGIGSRENKVFPVKVESLKNIVKVSAGSGYSLALDNRGVLWGFGGNDAGQALPANTEDQLIPQWSLKNVRDMDAGQGYTLILNNDGRLYSVGDNLKGRLGKGNGQDQISPIFVDKNIKTISAGFYHTMVVKYDGTVWTAGWNGHGQLGYGDKDDVPHLKLVQVPGLTDVTKVAAGYVHSFALKRDGSLLAFGLNDMGQFGDGTTVSSSEPKEVMQGVADVGSGERHTLFLMKDGTLKAAGNNVYGQLGNGSIKEGANPVPVQILDDVMLP